MDTHNPTPLIDRFFDAVYKSIETLCKIILIFMVVVISYTVFGRFVLNDTPTWGEELSIFCMVWVSVLAASLAIRDGRHIRMTIINFIVPETISIFLHKAAYVLVLLIGFVFVTGGIGLYKLLTPAIIGALGISSKWLALALPVSGLAYILMVLARFRRGNWT